MFNVAITPLQYLVSYAATFTAGAIGANVWRWYGNHMREMGREEIRNTDSVKGRMI